MRRLIVVFLALDSFSLFAQQPPAPGGGGGRGMTPKNLKIIKPEEIRTVMGAFVAGTGLTCMGCHVQGDFASDDKHEKVIARKMLEMVNEVNTKTFNGESKVSCFTCHRGEAHPKSAPDPK
jgi:hypothetical protein